ncbi:MAG: nucleotidyltransferase domain-containing protein [Pyrobaculum sp.]
MLPVYEIDIKEVVKKLSGLLGRRRQAVVFGSAAKWRIVHDIDVLIDGADFDEALRLAVKVEEILGIPADVVPAELAPPCLIAEALTEGMLIAVDWDYFDELLYKSVGLCQDVKIKWREIL